MKRLRAFIVVIMILICFMTGCSSNNTKYASYYERGLSLISLSKELVDSEELLKSYSINDEQKNLLDTLKSSDLSEPITVFSVNLPEKTLELLFEDTTQFSETVKSYLLNNAMASIPSMINTRTGGTNYMVAASVATASITFDSNDVKESVMYMFIFENGLTYAVNFKSGYDNSVFAVATPIFDDNLSSCRSADDMSEYLGKYSITAQSSDISIITGS